MSIGMACHYKLSQRGDTQVIPLKIWGFQFTPCRLTSHISRQEHIIDMREFYSFKLESDQNLKYKKIEQPKICASGFTGFTPKGLKFGSILSCEWN